MGKKYTYLSLPISPQLKQAVRVQAATMEISRSELCRRAIKHYLDYLDEFEAIELDQIQNELKRKT